VAYEERGDEEPIGAPYGRWYGRSTGWGTVLIVLLIVVVVLPAGAYWAIHHNPRATKIDSAGVLVADRFAHAAFVEQDCQDAAVTLYDPSRLLDDCGHGSTRPFENWLMGLGEDGGTDYYLVDEPSVVVPRCRFKGVYARYGPDTVGSDSGDNCVAYQLVWRDRPGAEESQHGRALHAAYVAVYLDKTHAMWTVAEYEAGNANCRPQCALLWRRRLPHRYTRRPPTRIDTAGVRVADRFVTSLFVLGDCQIAAKLAAPKVDACDVSVGDPRLGTHRLLPGCDISKLFNADYLQYSDVIRDDDTCIAYPGIEGETSCGGNGCSPSYSAGYIALYMTQTQGGWKVSGYRSDDFSNDCGDTKLGCQVYFAGGRLARASR
jgi:hypothetical protein